MALFILNSDITIGTFRFSGVHEVRVVRSIHSYVDKAYIKLPSLCLISQGKNASPKWLTTGLQFQDGDPVTINIGYNAATPAITANSGPTPVLPNNNNGLGTVFQGFVSRRDMGLPLEVECEGYSRLMRNNVAISGFYANTSASQLLALITQQVAITTLVPNDMPIRNLTLNNANGCDICDTIKQLSEGALSIFFISPTVLWCGLTYTSYTQQNSVDPFKLGNVSYRLGFNCIKDNGLKTRTTEQEPVQVIINGMLATGKRITTASQAKAQKRKVVSFQNNVPDVTTLQGFANEKQYQMNYAGLEGHVNGFLQPWCEPGYMAYIQDDRYPDVSGNYMVEATDVTFGVSGARIKSVIGPKFGFVP